MSPYHLPRGTQHSSNIRWRFLWFGVAVALLAVAACSEASSAIGQWYPGNTLHLKVVSIDRASEVQFWRSNAPLEKRRVTTSAIGTELVSVRMQVDNHTAVNAIVNVDRSGVELRDFANNSYFPLLIEESQVDTVDNASKSKVLNIVFSENQGFLEGSFELPKGHGLYCWVIFEVPEGTQFRELKWRAGDSITVRF